ncbi:uncharacterized protein PgNI_08690 [Pyricularia grisea]|uniref:Uncharacterized protein n=1 Tax=Pyricularia grisea TaxID=148305 RepID=A0A6P8AW82_PYRGI|nr:uncharacterized protein PgNI_08690 [Pyricularia grisea]TLD06455.1 hypothetical protein PgNI_08690 [Pyricularia grisea]
MDEGFAGPSMRPASYEELALISNIPTTGQAIRPVELYFMPSNHFQQLTVEMPLRSGACGKILSDLEGTSPAWPARPAIIIRMLYHALVHAISAKSTRVGTEKKSRN